MQLIAQKAGATRAERRAIQAAQRAAKAITKMTQSACEIILVRHGQTPWNVEQRMQGQLVPGPPLDRVGQEQAAAVAERLRRMAKNERIDALYSSDLLRATQTAEGISAAIGRPAVLSSQLRERHLGVMQGLTDEEAAVQQPEALQAVRAHGRAPGGGESVGDLEQRAAAALEDIARRHPGQRVIVVSHGGFIYCAHRRATGLAPPGKNVNGALNILKIDPSAEGGRRCSWAVVQWGVADHLSVVGALASSYGGGSKG